VIVFDLDDAIDDAIQKMSVVGDDDHLAEAVKCYCLYKPCDEYAVKVLIAET
jgi:L-fucose mutarotase/ribose pyranase (RbsD/FucU family)